MVAAFREHVPGQIALVQPLHDDHARAGPLVVETRAHDLIPPVGDRLVTGKIMPIPRANGIVDHNGITAKAGSDTVDGRRKALAHARVLVIRLQVDVGRELPRRGERLRIPVARDHGARAHGVARRESAVVRTEDRSPARPMCPHPRGPHAGNDDRLRVAGPDVDREPLNVCCSDVLEVFADRVDVPTGDERHIRLEHMPRLGDELAQRHDRRRDFGHFLTTELLLNGAQ
jgi:hypothetical protein